MDATVNVLQWLAAQEVKALVEGSGLSEEARAALHAIVRCAGSAALGAAGNVVLNNLIYGTDVDASKLSAQERENRINLLNSIITGVTLAVGGDSAMASAAAKIEAENNALSISNVDRVYTAIQQCLGNQSCRTEDLRKEFEDKEAEYLKTVINNCYGAGATVSTCRSSASALGTSIQHLDALRAQLGYNNSTPAEAQALAYVMYLWEDSTALLEDINQNMPTVDIPTQLNQIRDQLQEGKTGFWETASSVTGIYLTTTGFGTGGGNRSSRNRPGTGSSAASVENKTGSISSAVTGGGATAAANRPSRTPSGNLYVPTGTLKISNAHSVETIKPNTWWGDGDRNTPKTVALGGVDLKVDLQAIQADQGTRLADGKIQAPSGRIYGTHPESNSIYPVSGSGLMRLTQAEFRVYQQMLGSGGLRGNALKAFEGMRSSGNPGLNSDSASKLQQLYNSRESH